VKANTFYNKFHYFDGGNICIIHRLKRKTCHHILYRLIKSPFFKFRFFDVIGSGWLKLKPEYVDSLNDDLDLIILGGEYGSGHRGGMISHFLLGVAQAPDQPTDQPTKFMTFGKVYLFVNVLSIIE